MTRSREGPGAGPNGGALTAAIGRRKMAWVQRGIAAAGCRLFPSRWSRFRVPAEVSRWEPCLSPHESHGGDRRWIDLSALTGDEP